MVDEVKVVCVSDLHENLPEIPLCDLLLIAGDITFGFKGDIQAQAGFLEGAFRVWLDKINAEEVVVIAGNHDQNVEQIGWPEGLRCHYLQDSGIKLFGRNIWGTPWQPWFYNWAYNAPEINGEDFLRERFSLIPDDTDIIVSHSPPYGYGDKNHPASLGQPHLGSVALLEACERVKPELVVCGHIHIGYGGYEAAWGGYVVNASLVDNSYKPVNALVELEL